MNAWGRLPFIYCCLPFQWRPSLLCFVIQPLKYNVLEQVLDFSSIPVPIPKEMNITFNVVDNFEKFPIFVPAASFSLVVFVVANIYLFVKYWNIFQPTHIFELSVITDIILKIFFNFFSIKLISQTLW